MPILPAKRTAIKHATSGQPAEAETPPTKTETGNGAARKARDYTKLYRHFGVTLSPNGSPTEAVAEECPWCFKDRCYFNVTTGLYHCKHCESKGNHVTFLTAYHQRFLAETTNDHYRELKEKRGIAIQTLKRYQLAFREGDQTWLIPFKSKTGNVVNIQTYSPRTGKKYNPPELPLSLFNLDRLSGDATRIVYLCEGPFDAIALDYSLKEKRTKYDIIATPGPFKECWTDHFKGRKVRAVRQRCRRRKPPGARAEVAR